MNEVELIGKLDGPVIRVGGEGPSYNLLLPPIPLDMSKITNPAAYKDENVLIQGNLIRRNFAMSPEKQTFKVMEIVKLPDPVPATLNGNAVLNGTVMQINFRMENKRGLLYELHNSIVEIDMSSIPNADELKDKIIVVKGTFKICQYIERGCVWTFFASSAAEYFPKSKIPETILSGHLVLNTSLSDQPVFGDEAIKKVYGIGYSERFSFDEAFKNAIDDLPEFIVPYPDYLDVIGLESICAEFGGIAGFSRMKVTVFRNGI